MAEQTPWLLQSEEYSAQQVRQPFEEMLDEGICQATDLAVSERGAGANMSVDVAAGACWVLGDLAARQGLYWTQNDATLNLAIAAADPSNPRIDRIVARIHDTAHGDGSDDFDIYAITGTPAVSPAVPALPNSAIPLSRIAVAALATSITNANITDERDMAVSRVGPPTGSIMPYAAATAPSGWLICDGSAVLRTTYARLYAVIGTTFGVGNGTTTFNIPNLKGKIPVGFNSAETEFDTLGETGGAKTHTLITGEMPAHAHTCVTGATDTGIGSFADSESSGGTATTNSTGSGGAHNNLQPYMALPYIIKT